MKKNSFTLLFTFVICAFLAASCSTSNVTVTLDVTVTSTPDVVFASPDFHYYGFSGETPPWSLTTLLKFQDGSEKIPTGFPKGELDTLIANAQAASLAPAIPKDLKKYDYQTLLFYTPSTGRNNVSIEVRIDKTTGNIGVAVPCDNTDCDMTMNYGSGATVKWIDLSKDMRIGNLFGRVYDKEGLKLAAVANGDTMLSSILVPSEQEFVARPIEATATPELKYSQYKTMDQIRAYVEKTWKEFAANPDMELKAGDALSAKVDAQRKEFDVWALGWQAENLGLSEAEILAMPVRGGVLPAFNKAGIKDVILTTKQAFELATSYDQATSHDFTVNGVTKSFGYDSLFREILSWNGQSVSNYYILYLIPLHK